MTTPQRALPRYAVSAEIELVFGDVRQRGNTRNVSRGGLAAVVGQPIASGTTVSLTLQLVFSQEVRSEPLALSARVVWCTQIDDGWQLGVQFVGLRPEQATYVAMIVRYLAEGHTPRSSPSSTNPFSS